MECKRKWGLSQEVLMSTRTEKYVLVAPYIELTFKLPKSHSGLTPAISYVGECVHILL